MENKTITCIECNHDFEVPEEQEEFECPECGAEFDVDDLEEDNNGENDEE